MAEFSNALQSFLDNYGDTDTSSIPHAPSQCCCGNGLCTYLKDNQAALGDLERELQTSARLGQALLVRHETYMLDAEQQRSAMSRQLEESELEKKSLQQQNTTLVQENRGLLDQLESLNSAVTDSDARISSLQATLESAQLEIQKLAQLAARTESLERELALFEQEQATWHASLGVKEQAEKTAMRRWHDAERMLAKLQDQLQRIERESKEEKDRHAEVVARMERRHAVEKELDGAADRMRRDISNKDTRNSTVVSHFVKDILQDNATLQMGIVELRDMLQISNEEVEKLREQLQLHQPVEESVERPTIDRTMSLNDELANAKNQELHVHHHYHAPAAVQRSNSLKKPRKKRPVVTPSNASYTPSSSVRSTPRSSISFPAGTSAAAAILQQTAVSIPNNRSLSKRWSTQSAFSTPAYPLSMPASPTSTTNRTSSLFDRVFSDAGNESTSPPTSDGEAFSSPQFEPVDPILRTKRPGFKGHARGFSSGPGKQSLDSILDASVEDLPPLDARQTEMIEELDESPWHDVGHTVDDASHSYYDKPWHRPALRRAASHESLLSVSGMDIHTLKERPSQMLLPNTGMSSGAVISSFQVHAARPTGQLAARSGKSILSGMASDQRRPSAPLSKPGLVRKSSGWLFGRWGATPEASVDTAGVIKAVPPPPQRAASFASSNSDKPAPTTPAKVPQIRSPGINQAGPIFGFGPEQKIQHAPKVQALDQDALSRALGGA